MTEAGEHAFRCITHLDAEEAGGGIQRIADAIVTYVDEDGRYLAEGFADVPFTLTRTPTEPLAVAAGVSAALSPAGSAQQRGPDESGVCDILYLTLGPLQLDLLGLTVDLANVELDLDAVPGGGRLLGNLLCSVIGPARSARRSAADPAAPRPDQRDPRRDRQPALRDPGLRPTGCSTETPAWAAASRG